MTGGWVRNGIALDGAAPLEDSLVWWLQAPTRHVDLRLPRQGTQAVTCFAGITTWAAPSLTWTPDLQLEVSDAVDTGVCTWDGADLLEAGSFLSGGREVGYVERWQRLPGSDGELLALSTAHGRLVRTGDYALTVLDDRGCGGAFVCVAWSREGSSWSVHHSWPAGALAPAPPAYVGDAAAVALEDGRTWIVDEHRAAVGRRD